MSRLLAKIMLAYLMLPFAALVYFVAAATMFEVFNWYDEAPFAIAGSITWAFIAIYWFCLWSSSVAWTAARIRWTVGIAGGIAVFAVMFYVFSRDYTREEELVTFVLSTAAPLLWLVLTVFIWRETASERGARHRGEEDEHIYCPTCSYEMSSLTSATCPECGGQFTLRELHAAQPSREQAGLEH